MRKLNTQDVFKAFRLVTKSNLKAEITKLIEEIADKGYESIEKLGITGLLTALETLTDEKCEKMLYELLAGPYEMSAKDVANLDLDKQIEMLTTLYEENNLRNFFTLLSNLLKKRS